MTHTLTIRLQTALRGIISAVDGLGPHPSRHCPRVVLDAVEDLRITMNPVAENGTLSTEYSYGVGVDRADDGTITTRHEERFLWEVNERPIFSKRRIYLRGGPLDGCWYLNAPGNLDFCDYGCSIRFPFVRRDVEEDAPETVYHRAPDTDGICHFRP